MLKLIKSWLGPKFFFVTALTYTIAIIIGSLLPSEEIAKLDFQISDKFMHFIGYCFLVVFWFLFAFLSFSRIRYIQNLFIVSFFCMIFGIIIEVLQGGIILSREADIQDVIANFAGISAAFLALILIRNKILNLKNIN